MHIVHTSRNTSLSLPPSRQTTPSKAAPVSYQQCELQLDLSQRAMDRIHDQEYLSQVLKMSSTELDNLKQKAFKNVSELHTLITFAQSVDALTTATHISVFKTP